MRKVTLALVALVLFTTGYVVAQVSKVTPATPPNTAQAATIEPVTDLGLRIEGEHDGRITGTLMVKVDGRWKEVQLASKTMRAN